MIEAGVWGGVRHPAITLLFNTGVRAGVSDTVGNLEHCIMPRALRVDYAGAWHHVMNRGSGQRPIFADDFDRRRFLIELRDACQERETAVAAYCLMTNHYHLVLFTPKGGLSEIMQAVSSK